MRRNYWLPTEVNFSGHGPKLINAIKFYEIETDEDQLHQASYDVEMTRKVFEKMLQLSTVRMKKWADTYPRIKETTF